MRALEAAVGARGHELVSTGEEATDLNTVGNARVGHVQARTGATCRNTALFSRILSSEISRLLYVCNHSCATLRSFSFGDGRKVQRPLFLGPCFPSAPTLRGGTGCGPRRTSHLGVFIFLS
jgi:hypothetical protein